MMPNPFVGPIGDVPCDRHTTANPPSNHSHVSVLVTFPPGPNGLGFISPVIVHVPTKYASFWCSAVGFGACGGCCDARLATAESVKTANAWDVLFTIAPPEVRG